MALLASQGIGFLFTTLILIGSGEPLASTESLLWAAFAGIAGVGGLAFFYLALSRGTMGLVAPLAALIGAGVPVLLSIVEGESIDAARLLGIAAALVAVVLISLPTGPESPAEQRAIRIDISELPIVVLSGLGFAGFFIGIDRATSTGATWWPLEIVRVCGVTLVLLGIVLAAWRTGSGTPTRRLTAVLGVDRFRAAGRTFMGRPAARS